MQDGTHFRYNNIVRWREKISRRSHRTRLSIYVWERTRPRERIRLSWWQSRHFIVGERRNGVCGLSSLVQLPEFVGILTEGQS
jgi:hypothetical protein